LNTDRSAALRISGTVDRSATLYLMQIKPGWLPSETKTALPLLVENDLHVYEVSVSTEFQDNLPKIMADRTQLQQVILNLVKNAIEAMATAPTTIKPFGR
jgi:signal transduction histidine kinase